MQKLSVIIPTLNEEVHIGSLLDFLITELSKEDEIIIVDGGSLDNTTRIVADYPVQLIKSKRSCRSIQLNLGANQAIHPLLYFVHADTQPPKGFKNEIGKAIKRGFDCGCFSFRFDQSSILLSFNEFFTQFPNSGVGGGDQTLFLKKSIFKAIGGFNEELVLMEDFDLTGRLRKKYNYKIIRKDVIVSARKYANNSWLKVQFANMLVFTAFKFGVSQHLLKKAYSRLLK